MNKNIFNGPHTWGIWLNVLFLAMEGVLFALAAFFSLALGVATIIGWLVPFSVILTGFALMIGAIGLIYLWVCKGLLMHTKAAWYVTMVVLFISFLVEVVFPLMNGFNFFSLVILVVLVIRGVGLLTERTRKLFGIEL